jgi:hypothetical protein
LLLAEWCCKELSSRARGAGGLRVLELGCGAAPAAGLACIAIGCSVLMTDLPPVLEHTVRDLPGWLSALSVFHSKSVLFGAFVWARIAWGA